MKPIVLIPSRMAATRLPRKPMADIHGVPMIVHVWRRAMEADIGPVAVATDSGEIAEAVRAAGGQAVMTRADHATGSDRILEALHALDPDGRFDVVVNVQGDLPTLRPDLPGAAASLLATPEVDIGTLVTPFASADEAEAPQMVKAIATPLTSDGRHLRALYFTRVRAPSGEGAFLHHIGLYAYRRSALERFCALPPAPLESREKLEQLRALENGMRIDVAVVDTVPLGVDTPEDLERARALLAPRGA